MPLCVSGLRQKKQQCERVTFSVWEPLARGVLTSVEPRRSLVSGARAAHEHQARSAKYAIAGRTAAICEAAVGSNSVEEPVRVNQTKKKKRQKSP